MFRFTRRLFGNDVTTADSRGGDDTELVVHRSSRAHKPCVSDTYFDTMSRMQAAVSNRDYEGAARLVCESQVLLRTRSEYRDLREESLDGTKLEFIPRSSQLSRLFAPG